MSAYLSFEWLKLSKRWMPRIILLLLLGLTILAFWAQATRTIGRANLFLPRGWLAALAFCAFFAPFFWPVLGGSWAGNEYGWGTIRTILTRRPQRVEHVIAALVVLLVGVGIGLLAILVVGSIASIIIASVTGNSAFTSALWDGTFLGILVKGFLTTWYVSAFYLVFAYAAATIFRSAAVGIGVGIGATFAQVVLMRIFIGLGGVWNQIAIHFPFNYSSSVITRVVGPGLVPGSNLASSSPTDPSAGTSLLALAIYSVVFLALTFVAVRTRDVTA